VLETTALGAAYLAGPPEKFAARWSRDKRFSPKMKPAVREMKYAGWKDSVRKLLA
jgi:glycerol kinase